MEQNKLTKEQYNEEVVKFAKEFARIKMPKYESEWLIVAYRPTPDFNDEISQLSWEQKLFRDIPHNSFCRQFIFSNNEYKERTLEEIKAGKPEVKAKKVIYVDSLDGPDYFRMDYEGAEFADEGGEKKHVVGQGWQIDMEWDGAKFNLIEKSNHRTLIT
jgi:hypothetical protein